MTVTNNRPSAESTLPPDTEPAAPAPTNPAPKLNRPEKKVRVDTASEYSVIRIANFDSKEERNDYDGGYFGPWTGAPDDPTQGCEMKFVEPGRGDGGYCLKLTYDVDAFHNAFNGFWLLFVDIDLTAYTNLCFWVRGDPVEGFTTRFNIEMKNEDEAGRTLVDKITTEWQLVKIPLREFVGVNNWYQMTEFVIVFEDRLVSKKRGSIYLDDIYFETSPPKGTVDMADPHLTREEAEKARTRKDE